MTEQCVEYVPQDTKELQITCLDVFMLGLGYMPHDQVKYRSHDGKNIFSFSTALRLFKETNWYEATKYASPSFNPEIRLPRYQVNCAVACKPITRVKLAAVGKEIVVLSDKLTFSKPGYEKLFLKKKNHNIPQEENV